MRRARNHFECGALTILVKEEPKLLSARFLMVIPMQNQSWHVKLFEIFGEVRR
jgi:hypothetical protein